MRRRDRPNTWGLWGDFVPVAQRAFRREVKERTLADGTIREVVDPVEVKAVAQELLAMGAEALCIVFINAYANAANERVPYEAARAVWPNGHVAYSAEILPEIREFERTSTTALNGYLQPVVANYLGKLDAALAADAYQGSFHIVQSNGGVMSTAMARKFPIRTALSGPAAGVIAAGAIARASGIENIITADLGARRLTFRLSRVGCRSSPRRRRLTSVSSCARPWWRSRPSARVAGPSHTLTAAACWPWGPRVLARGRGPCVTVRAIRGRR
ncbi:MAG: hypothetical protein RL291_150, partial [Pseudomonadota bacterium]